VWVFQVELLKTVLHAMMATQRLAMTSGQLTAIALVR
jgi:hypothetical protein